MNLEVRIVNLIGDIKYIGEIVSLTNNTITMKDPVEVEWIDTERGLIVRVDNPIKDSASRFIIIRIENVVSSYEPSYELKMYYELIIPKIHEQRDGVIRYLSTLTETVATKLMDERMVDSLMEGKLLQPGSSSLS